MEFLRQFRSNPRLLLLGGAVLIVLLGTVVLTAAFKKDIVLIVDGEAMQVRSGARTAGSALRDAGFRPGSDDQVIPEPDRKINDGDVIELRRIRRVRLEIDQQAQWIDTAEISPIGILAAAGVSMEEGDRLWADGERLMSEALETELRPSHLRLKRAVTIVVDVDGDDFVIHSAASSIGEALWENDIQLVEGDEIS
ncbi:MAG: ubiquitin-like domain-containing protein, partial [Anaerolineales bacterium]